MKNPYYQQNDTFNEIIHTNDWFAAQQPSHRRSDFPHLFTWIFYYSSAFELALLFRGGAWQSRDAHGRHLQNTGIDWGKEDEKTE